MAIDASIPLGVQSPLQNLSGLLDIKSKMQQQQLQQQTLQSNDMANQQSAIDLEETQRVRPILANLPKYQDAQGNIDFNKLAPEVAQVAPKNFAHIMTSVMQAQQAHTAAVQSVNTLDADSRSQVGGALYSLKGSKPEVIGQTISQFEKAYPNLTPAFELFRSRLQSAGDNQTAVDDLLDQAGKMVQAPPTQQTMNTPAVATNDNGMNYQGVNLKPGVQGLPQNAPVPGLGGTHQLPPTTPTIDPQTGQPGYLGPQGGNPQDGPAAFVLSGDKIRDMGMLNAIRNDPKQSPEIRNQAAAKLHEVQSGGGKPFVASALPPGQQQNIVNNVDDMNRHFGGLQDQASGAQLIDGLLGNIKALTSPDTSGTGSGKKAFVSGLLAALHVPGTGDTQRDLDLLEKNMAQLNLGTGGSTDAARTLVAAARPHSSMNPEAVREAADQVAGQVKANIAIRNVLYGYKVAGDVRGYNDMRQKLEQVADPRVWQYQSLSPAEGKKFLQKLTPEDRATLIQKTQQLEQLGLIK